MLLDGNKAKTKASRLVKRIMSTALDYKVRSFDNLDNSQGQREDVHPIGMHHRRPEEHAYVEHVLALESRL